MHAYKAMLGKELHFCKTNICKTNFPTAKRNTSTSNLNVTIVFEKMTLRAPIKYNTMSLTGNVKHAHCSCVAGKVGFC